MKVIFSHDIDHLTFWEHYKDSIIPKYYIRNNIEVFKGKISVGEYLLRYSDPFHNKWQFIEEIMEWNTSLGIKSNFFIGVNNGLGLSYSSKKAKKWIDKIRESNFEIGVHGINYQNLEEIKKEYDLFASFFGNEPFGMRMHYLRNNENTLHNISNAGYFFDSTDQGIKNPYKIGNMWEFPLQIMDGWCFYNNTRYKSNSLEEAKDIAKKVIKESQEKQLKYLNVLFHDRYYTNSFKDWKNWYNWITHYLVQELSIEPITYSQAVKELNEAK